MPKRIHPARAFPAAVVPLPFLSFLVLFSLRFRFCFRSRWLPFSLLVSSGTTRTISSSWHLLFSIAAYRPSGNPSPVEPLTPPDSHYLLAAQGWIELGNYLEANEELEKISPRSRLHPDVLEIRVQVYANAKKWDACAHVASTLVKLAPERLNGWVQRSFALHELRRTQEAFDNLLPVAEKFPGIWTIPYNLACYSSQLGRLDEAKDWLKKALLIGEETVQRVGIADPDLKPLWASMSTPI